VEFESRPYIESHEIYLKHSFPILKSIFLKFHHPYKAFISGPAWMWGAEMGVNECGLAIGNEAVFSKEKVPQDGLLGMDILRLALHNNKTAKAALDFLIAIMGEYNQGGDGGYRHSMKYSNSFLIKDPAEAYLLETSARHWAVRKIETCATISNSYTITGNYEAIDPGSENIKKFKAKYENKLVTYFAQGDPRQTYSINTLRNEPIDLMRIKNLLRSHINKTNALKKGMHSLCIHASLIKSETTASLIADYSGEQLVVWFTGSPHPCVSLFKPFIFSSFSQELPFTVIDHAVDYSRKQQLLAKKMIKNYDLFSNQIKPLRDEYENEFSRIIYGEDEIVGDQSIEERCLSCFDLEKDYWRQVDGIFKKYGI
jgi:secernin